MQLTGYIFRIIL